jgi:hypothetical protein
MAVLPAEACGLAQVPDRIDCEAKPLRGLAWPRDQSSSSSAAARISGSAGMRGENSPQLVKLREQSAPIRDGAVDALE